jgi:hypothetical protein
MRRGDLPYHLQRSCPENAIVCPYGCPDPVLRKELREHMAANMSDHLDALRVAHHKTLTTLETNFHTEIMKRDLEIEALRSFLKQGTRIVWVIEGWAALLAQKGYTQSKVFPLAGHQWYLGVYSDGDSDDSRGFLSVYLFLEDVLQMKGKKISLEFALRVINHKEPNKSKRIELKTVFPVQGAQGWGERKAFPAIEFTEEGGFVLGGKLVMEVEVFIKRVTLFV